MKQVNAKNFFLRVIATFAMFLVILLFISPAVFVFQNLHNSGHSTVKEGLVSPAPEMVQQKTIQLNGSWDSFNDVVCQTPEEIAGLGQTYQNTSFPIGYIDQAQRDATYRIYLQLSDYPEDGLYLSIPNYDGRLNVFCNGVRQEPVPSQQQWIASHALKSVYPLTGIKEGQELQELVISGNFSEQSITLYRRPILLGTMQNISAHVMADSSFEMMILGMLLLILVNGYVFMLFRPNHLLITLITVFDTLLINRLLFAMNYTFSIYKAIFPGFLVSDRMCLSIELFFLMMAGFVGCVLSKKLFTPTAAMPRWLTLPPMVGYLIFAAVFPFNTSLFEKYGLSLLILLYIYTFIGVFCEFIVCWRTTTRRGYYLFQFLKTSYIGCIVFLDISTWNLYMDFSVFLYLYTFFFLLHVVVRLYDNNQSYQNVEILNRDLEKTVAERTLELSKANQILSELSIRDPLTNAFNRLYFEDLMERLLARPENICLCIFDLDLFKKINDTYGHQAGDEMLCILTKIVNDTVKTDAVFARIGGEEFVLVYERTPISQVLKSINAVHRAVEQNSRLSEKYTSASFGVAIWTPGDTEKDLLRKADTALYEAKAQGRNRIVLHSDIEKLLEENPAG